MAKEDATDSVPSPPPVESDTLSPSTRLIEQHGLDRLTEEDTNLYDLLRQSTTKIHSLVLQGLQAEPKLDLDTASKIADRLTRSLKAHYELLALKGKIHDRDDRRGKIVARVGIRQSPQGPEAIAEVEMRPGHHPA